ncbi:Imm1 family immunity protein [Amycolatopsis jejuensis]|uniref:Imm1 family immunity protein n=1 Tax=Amycolatopsis jejuensis TaxID=330084 RepID=UPI00052737E0|nr:Imm1 family immunity protein [Amycolatopsis jejuensis]
MTETALPDADGHDVAALLSVGPLLDRITNAEHDPDKFGVCWVLYAQNTPDDCAGSLTVGVRGDRGMLHWSGADGSWLKPASGLNEDEVTYFTYLGQQDAAEPGMEVTLSTVLEAVEEFHRTHRRPTNVDWVPVQPEKSGNNLR